MINDIIGYQSQWHFNLLVSIKRCFKVHIFDVVTTKFGIGHADNAVLHEFG
jgi:hypothetical protein